MNKDNIKLMAAGGFFVWVLYPCYGGDWVQAIFAYLVLRDFAESL